MERIVLRIRKDRAYMKKIVIPLILLLSASLAQAQNPTIVTGTIVDPASVPYYPGSVTACLTPVTIDPIANGRHINNSIGANYCPIAGIPTTSTGAFTASIPPNSSITPGGTQYVFTVTALGSGPPAGKGPQTFQSTITIAGATQDVSATLNAVALTLLNSGGGGIGGSGLVYGADPKYGMKWDAQITWGCVYSNGVATISCPNATFTSADIGKNEFATNITRAGFGSASTSIQTIPYGTITGFVDSTHVTVSPAPTSNSVASSDSFNYGTEEGAKLNTAWHVAADACGTLVLPAARTMSARGQFNYFNNLKCNLGTGADKRGTTVYGQGMFSTMILLTPNFDFTFGAGTSCDGFNLLNGCFLSAGNGLHAHDFEIYGAGLNLGLQASINLIDVSCDNCALDHLNLSSFQAQYPGQTGLSYSGAFSTLNYIVNDGFGGQNCAIIGTGTTPGSNPARISDSYCGDSAGTALVVGSGVVESVNNFFQGGSGDGASIGNAGTMFNSTNDKFYAGGTGPGGGRPLVTVSPAVVNVDHGSFFQTGTNGVGFLAFNGGKISIRDSNIGGAAACTGIYVFDVTSKVVDNGGNIDTCSIPVNNAGPGSLAGSRSITGVLQSGANWSVPAGAGAGQWGTSPPTPVCAASYSVIEQCTITVGSGAVGANPILTVTFPTSIAGFAGFWVAPICDAKMIGGTAAIAQITTGTVSATTAQFTYNGTPGAGTTIILKVSCSNE
jgi:hypothetical protein